jgi:hypothetical protein
MDIINEMKKTRSYKKHVKLLNELIQFTSKSKKNEKLILKVADLHLVLAKSIQICSKGMKMEGGGLFQKLKELFGNSNKVAPAPSFDKIGEMTEMPPGTDTSGRPVFVPGAQIIP